MLRVQALQAAAAASNDPAMKEALTQETEAAAAAAAAEDPAGSSVAADGAASAADGAAGAAGLLAEVGVVQTLRARVAELEAELRQVGCCSTSSPLRSPAPHQALSAANCADYGCAIAQLPVLLLCSPPLCPVGFCTTCFAFLHTCGALCSRASATSVSTPLLCFEEPLRCPFPSLHIATRLTALLLM